MISGQEIVVSQIVCLFKNLTLLYSPVLNDGKCVL